MATQLESLRTRYAQANEDLERAAAYDLSERAIARYESAVDDVIADAKRAGFEARDLEPPDPSAFDFCDDYGYGYDGTNSDAAW